MNNFKLLHYYSKHGRTIKTLAEYSYVRIGGMSIEPHNPMVTIQISANNDNYALQIPFNKIDSVIERLQEAKLKAAKWSNNK